MTQMTVSFKRLDPLLFRRVLQIDGWEALNGRLVEWQNAQMEWGR